MKPTNKDRIQSQINKWQKRYDNAMAEINIDVFNAITFDYHKSAAIAQMLISNWTKIMNSGKLDTAHFIERRHIYSKYLRQSIKTEADNIRHEVYIETLDFIDNYFID